MRVLVDTQILIWFLTDTRRLGPTALEALEDSNNTVFFSAASIWEVAIKAKLGRADFQYRPVTILHEAIEIGFCELPVHAVTSALVAELPLHHRDPFDRLLVAQAMSETLTLYTADPRLQPYSPLVKLLRQPEQT